MEKVKSGRYASYWNVFLFGLNFYITKNLNVCLSVCLHVLNDRKGQCLMTRRPQRDDTPFEVRDGCELVLKNSMTKV